MKTVFVNGCFDILHRGHVELFSYARGLGERLIVAIDSDEKVRKDKGPARPINNLVDRKYVLSKLKDIDEVLEFYSPAGLEDLIRDLKPDIMVVGGDWKGKPIVGSQHAGRVEYFDRIPGYSTTRIINSKP